MPQRAFLCFRKSPLLLPHCFCPQSSIKPWRILQSCAQRCHWLGLQLCKEECLRLLNRSKPYWMTALWRQTIFFYIKRAFIKNILWGQHQRKVRCRWPLQRCYAKPPAPACSRPRMSHAFLHPAASQTSSPQHTVPVRLPWDDSLQQTPSHTIGNKSENHSEAS